jgi:hypothetical protein
MSGTVADVPSQPATPTYTQNCRPSNSTMASVIHACSGVADAQPGVATDEHILGMTELLRV